MSSSTGFCPRCGKPLPPAASFCPACGAAVSPAGTAAAQAPMSGIDMLMKESTAQSYWIRRLIAFAIDAVIVSIALGIVALFLALPFFFVSGPAVFGSLFAGAYSFADGIVLVLYFTFAEALTGRTVGKMIFGLDVRVVGAGRPPTFSEAIARNISKIYWLLLLLDTIVGLALAKNYRQKFSDKYAGTEVVEGTRPL